MGMFVSRNLFIFISQIYGIENIRLACFI